MRGFPNTPHKITISKSGFFLAIVTKMKPATIPISPLEAAANF